MATKKKKVVKAKISTNNKNKKQKKQKIEFSKLAFLCTSVSFGAVIIGSFALMWHTQTTDALGYLITATAGLTTTATGFYYWKAKVENVIKISNENGLSINEVKSISADYTDDVSYDEDM